jgi:hypothetical protein
VVHFYLFFSIWILQCWVGGKAMVKFKISECALVDMSVLLVGVKIFNSFTLLLLLLLITFFEGPLCARYIKHLFNSHNGTEWVPLLCFHKWRHWGLEKLDNWPKVRQLLSGWLRFECQYLWLLTRDLYYVCNYPVL